MSTSRVATHIKLTSMLMLLVLGCGAESEHKVASPAPAQATVFDAQEPDASILPAADPRVDLQLPMLGLSREQLVKEFPGCAKNWNQEQSLCRFHGSLGHLPLSKQCRDGCAWREYEFTAGRLSRVRIQREVYDADLNFASAFAEEAKFVAEALDSHVGKVADKVENLAKWDEDATHPGESIVLSQRRWQLENATLTWKLIQDPGHHPGVLLHIELQSTTTP